MKTLETAPTFALDDEHEVVVAGDWHGNVGWAKAALRMVGGAARDVRTILHVGDFWPTPRLCDVVDDACQRARVERVLVTLGNHEPYDWVRDLPSDEAVRISRTVWILPRPFRFTVAGVTFLSLGGAASVDRQWRRPGLDWWPEEAISDAQVDAAIAGGPASVMITHETPDSTPVRRIRDILESNPFGFPREAREYSAASRDQVQRVWDSVSPRLLFHGHMHAAGVGMTADGRRVISLHQDGYTGNMVSLRLDDLSTDHLQNLG